MRRTVGLKMVIDRSLRDEIQAMADEKGVTFDALLSRSIRAIEIFRRQRAIGRTHMGFVADRTKLDAELIL